MVITLRSSIQFFRINSEFLFKMTCFLAVRGQRRVLRAIFNFYINFLLKKKKKKKGIKEHTLGFIRFTSQQM